MCRFKVGERVLLRPVSIRDPRFVVPGDDTLLEELARNHQDNLYWLAGASIDWVSECFLPLPVYIISVVSETSYCYGGVFTPEYRIFYEPRELDILEAYYGICCTWVIPETALMPVEHVTRTRRLTVRKF